MAFALVTVTTWSDNSSVDETSHLREVFREMPDRCASTMLVSPNYLNSTAPCSVMNR
jgi:hypothetical protein